jgi:hypothetical protein
VKRFKDVDGVESLEIELEDGTIDVWAADIGAARVRSGDAGLSCLDAPTARDLAAYLVELADKLEAEG